MKPTLILAALAVLANATAAQAGKRGDEAAILKIEDDMAAAQTVDAILTAWDKDVVWFDMLPGEANGIKEVRKSLGAQVDAVRNIRIKIKRIKVETGKDLAFAWSTQHLVADGRNGGPALDVVFRQTDCFERKKGHWKLVHQHLSVPFDPATGRPVFDGQ